VCTIDPDTAKDFDDALSIVPLKDSKGWYELGVHIADVGHFLPFNSPTDKHAQEKATSIYLVNKCLPMLPPHLSEDACSLVPNQDRNTFSVFLRLTKKVLFARLALQKHSYTLKSASPTARHSMYLIQKKDRW
jgi:exoribonuclease R